MKSLESKSSKNPLKVKIENKISNLIKSELPKLHLKLIKKFKGKHSLINNFIYVPDIVNGNEFHALEPIHKATHIVNQYMTTKNIKYDLIGFSFNKLMKLKFEYLIEHEETGLISTAWVLEDTDGWRVTKIEAYWEVN